MARDNPDSWVSIIQGDDEIGPGNPLEVSGAASRMGTFTDRSGSIAVGGTSQSVMAANTSRRYLFIQNVSNGDLWIDFGSAAEQTQPSIKLVPGASFVMEGSFLSTQSVAVVGATAGQAYTAKEGNGGA